MTMTTELKLNRTDKTRKNNANRFQVGQTVVVIKDGRECTVTEITAFGHLTLAINGEEIPLCEPTAVRPHRGRPSEVATRTLEWAERTMSDKIRQATENVEKYLKRLNDSPAFRVGDELTWVSEGIMENSALLRELWWADPVNPENAEYNVARSVRDGEWRRAIEQCDAHASEIMKYFTDRSLISRSTSAASNLYSQLTLVAKQEALKLARNIRSFMDMVKVAVDACDAGLTEMPEKS